MLMQYNAPPTNIRQRHKQGMWLLVGSLGIFFLASMLLYLYYVSFRLQHSNVANNHLQLPRAFWVSTILLVIISGLLHWAIKAAKRDRTVQIVVRTGGALLAGVAFLLVQTQAMATMVSQTREFGNSAISPYPLTIVLALLHALHVIPGVFGICTVVVRALMMKYDHEQYTGLEVCAIYWHFLDVVWLVLLLGFFVVSAMFA